jgi:hypothetical protein
MFAFCVGLRPNETVRAATATLFAAAAALCVAGCAADNRAYYADASPTYVPRVSTVEIEEDGMPSQAAPPARIRQMPDDPSQPFSRNYGGSNPAGVVPVAPTVKASNEPGAPKLSIPDDLPPAFRRQLATAVDAAG